MKKLLSILLIGFYSSLAHSESDFTLYNYSPYVITNAYVIGKCGTTTIPLPQGGLLQGDLSRFTTGGHWWSPCKVDEVDVRLAGGKTVRQSFSSVDNRNFCVGIPSMEQLNNWGMSIYNAPLMIYDSGGMEFLFGTIYSECPPPGPPTFLIGIGKVIDPITKLIPK